MFYPMSEDDNVTSCHSGSRGRRVLPRCEFGLTFKRHEDFARGESRYWDRADRLREDKTRVILDVFVQHCQVIAGGLRSAKSHRYKRFLYGGYPPA